MNTFQSIDCLLAAGLVTEDQATELSQVTSKLPGSQAELYKLLTALRLTSSEPAVTITLIGPDGIFVGHEAIITGGVGPYLFLINGEWSGSPVTSPTEFPEHEEGDLIQVMDINGNLSAGVVGGGEAPAPAISGAAYPGETLTSDKPGQWYLDGVAVGPSLSTNYFLPLESEGKAVTVDNSAPVTVKSYDYYVDPIAGNDANAGSKALPWQTLARVVTYGQTDHTNGSEKRIFVTGGDYIDQSVNITRNGDTTPNKATKIYIKFGPSSKLQWTLGTDQSGIQATGSNWTLEPRGWSNTDRLRITGFNVGTGNGLGAHNTAKLWAQYINVDDCIDGVSGHGDCEIYTSDCSFSNCSKSAWQHVQNARHGHYRCTFTGRSGASAGIGQNDSTCIGDFEDCSFIPVTTGQIVTLGIANAKRCKFGTQSMRVVINGVETLASNITDSYFNVALDGRFPFQLLRCYGLLSLRQRGTLTNPDMLIRNCVFVGRATGVGVNGGFYGDTDSGAAWQGNGIVIENTIWRGYGTAIGQGFSANQLASFNSASTLRHNCYFANTTTNLNAGITIDTNSITVDPLLGPANTQNQSDYYTASNSPCRGAGVAGANIGLPS